MLGNGEATTVVSVPGEIGLPAGEWYDYDNKYLKDVATLQIPAHLPAELVTRLRDIALRAFRVAGCKGLARVDGLDYTALLTRLCELALAHHAERQRLSVTR